MLTMTDRLFTITEVVEELSERHSISVKRHTVGEIVKSREIPTFKIRSNGNAKGINEAGLAEIKDALTPKSKDEKPKRKK